MSLVVFQIGEYRPSEDTFTLTPDTLLESVSSQCPGSCTECRYLDRPSSRDQVSLDGDFIIGSLLNVHSGRMGSNDPYQCGSLDPSTVQLVEALKFAIELVNDERAPVSLNNIRLGALVLDACDSGVRAANLVSNIHSGFCDGEEMGMEGDSMRSKVVAWLSQGSDVNTAADAVLSRLDLSRFVLEGEGSGMNDGRGFQLRTGSERTIAAVIAFLKHNNWNNIQLVSDMDSPLLGKFTTMAQEQDVCILQHHEGHAGGSYAGLITRMIDTPSQVVVSLLSLNELGNLLEARQSAGSGAQALFFISVQGHIDNPVTMSAAFARTVMIGLNSSAIAEFDEYLAAERPSSKNPWFDDFYQATWQCNLQNNYDFGAECGDVATNAVTAAPGYQQNPRIGHVINSVFSLAQSLDTLLKRYCGSDYDGICGQFPMTSELRSQLKDAIKSASFRDLAGNMFRFDQEGFFDRGVSFYAYNDEGEPQEVSLFVLIL